MTSATKEEVDLQAVGVEDFHRAIRSISKQIKQAHSLPELSEMSERLYQMTQRAVANSKNNSPFDQSELFSEESRCLQEKIGQMEEKCLEEIDALLSDVIITDGDIDLMAHRLNLLSPEEIAEKLLELSQKLERYKQSKSSTGFIQKKIINSVKKLDHLSFRYLFPIFEELNEDSYQNNFAYQMQSLSSMFLNDDPRSEMFYLTLSPSQRTAIERFGKDRAKAIQNYITSLRDLAELAELFYFEGDSETLSYLEKLPKETLMALQQYAWRDESMQALEDMKAERIAQIIMQYLSDVILD